jgi:hypothetical protein
MVKRNQHQTLENGGLIQNMLQVKKTKGDHGQKAISCGLKIDIKRFTKVT